MKVGDIVESIYGPTGRPQPGSLGLIVDIDPLRQTMHCHFQTVNEIVVMLDNGVLWHASPSAWEVISESR